MPHTQLYTECARLAGEGLLDEPREQTRPAPAQLPPHGRGRQALERWRAEPASELYELRDAAMLKLFFGADPATLAQTPAGGPQRAAGRLRGAARGTLEHMTEGQRLALEAGIGHEREFVRFWQRCRLAALRRGAAASALAEQVLLGGRSSAAAPGPSSSLTKRSRPSIEHDRLAGVLRAREVRAGGGGVGDGEPGGAQLAARARRRARASRRAARRPARPIATSSWPWRQARPKLSLIRTRDARARSARAGARAARARRRRGRAGSTTSVSLVGGVGGVDAGVGADEAVAGAADQHAALGAHDLGGLVEDDLHRARRPCRRSAASSRARARG